MLGLTTAPADANEAEELAARIGTTIQAAEVWLCDDAVTSHAGALSLGWGVSVVAGTGVACLTVPADGEPRIVGGHGYLIGDEGGAFWIGREGHPGGPARDGRPRRIDDADGTRRGPVRRPRWAPRPTPRRPAPRRRDREVCRGRPRRRRHGSGRRGDRHEAATELHTLTTAAARVARPADDDAAPVPVALGGRLLVEPTSLRRALDACLAGDATLQPRTADHAPLDGAMLLGRQPTPGRYASLVHIWQSGRHA